MKEQSWFGGKQEKSGEGFLNKAGKGIITVSTVVGAGILVGMGFEAFRGASENI